MFLKHSNHLKFILLIFSISVFVVSCGKKDNAEKKQKMINSVDVYIVQSGDLKNDIFVTGNLLADEQVDIKAQEAGNIVSINFQEGKPVVKGQLLVKIDDRDWKAQLQAANVNLETLNKDLTRKKELLKINGVSVQDVENAENNIANVKSQIEQLKVKIDYSEIRAPFSGVVGLRNFSPGAYLSVGQTITTLVKSNPIKIDFQVPSNYAHSLKVGQTIQMVTRSNKDTINAKIYAYDPLISETSRTIKVRAVANNPNNKYLPGDFADVLLTLADIKDAILIPSEAVVPQVDKQTIFIVKNGKSVSVPVQIGIRTNRMVEVISGANVGDTLIMTGLVTMRSGIPLKINKVLNIINN